MITDRALKKLTLLAKPLNQYTINKSTYSSIEALRYLFSIHKTPSLSLVTFTLNNELKGTLVKGTINI